MLRTFSASGALRRPDPKCENANAKLRFSLFGVSASFVHPVSAVAQQRAQATR